MAKRKQDLDEKEAVQSGQRESLFCICSTPGDTEQAHLSSEGLGSSPKHGLWREGAPLSGTKGGLRRQRVLDSGNRGESDSCLNVGEEQILLAGLFSLGEADPSQQTSQGYFFHLDSWALLCPALLSQKHRNPEKAEL